MLSKKPNDFFIGINYWDSVHATEMWKYFDDTIIEEDFRVLKEAGIEVLRVFPRWSDFQPLTAAYTTGRIYEMQIEGKPLPDTEAGQAGVSEEMCRNFDRFCDLAEQYELNLMVGIITGQMSFGLFVPSALEGRDPLTDPLSIRWQIRFARYFVQRFKSKRAIIGWDLGNEPNCLGAGDEHEFYNWMNNIANTIRVSDPSRPVISGLATINNISTGRACYKDVAEICDFNTTHPYAIFDSPTEPLASTIPMLNPAFYSKLAEDIAGTPTFPQEFGAIGYLTCTETEEAEFYRAAMLASIAYCCHGGMYWCAFDQGELDFAPYNWNNIGSQYGFFREDRSAKEIVKANLQLQDFIKQLPSDFTPPVTNAVVLVEREDLGNLIPKLRTTFALAKRAGIDVTFCSALDPIPDASLYLFPSVSSPKAITKTRLNELLEKVKEGATLYLSLDTALFREIPEITGVCSHARYLRNKITEMILDDAVLPLESKTTYHLEPKTAESIASDSNGEPVFFRNRYGKGFVFFTQFPVEKMLQNRPGFFYEEEVPPYEKLYKQLLSEVSPKRIAQTDNHFILLTEHIVDETKRYLFAINFSDKEQTTTLKLPKENRISVIWGTKYANDTITLKAGDGILLVAGRNE